MAFKRHSSFTPAPNEDSKLWRYMSLPKFLSLIQQNSLFMGNLERMAHDDKFEGILPSANFVHRKWMSVNDVPLPILNKLKMNVIYYETGNLQACLENYKELQELRIKQAFAHRRSYFVNCWHLNEYESLAMWDIYSKKDEGIAIVSSESNFIDAFSSIHNNIFGGIIDYADYESPDFTIDVDNGFNSIMCKRASYDYEREYRLVFWDKEVTHKYIPMQTVEFDSNGKRNISHGRASIGRCEEDIENTEPKLSFNVKCDLSRLINEIYVSPSAPSWFFDIVDNLVKKYEVNVSVKQSILSKDTLR